MKKFYDIVKNSKKQLIVKQYDVRIAVINK